MENYMEKYFTEIVYNLKEWEHIAKLYAVLC